MSQIFEDVLDKRSLFEDVLDKRSLSDGYLKPVCVIDACGKAVPAGSKRVMHSKAGKPFVVPMGKGHYQWRQYLRELASLSMRGAHRISGPVGVTYEFRKHRPKSHFRTGRYAGQLKSGVPRMIPRGKPDVTKVIRGVEDALTGIVWDDDSQVDLYSVFRRYTRTIDDIREDEGVLICVFDLTGVVETEYGILSGGLLYEHDRHNRKCSSQEPAPD